MSGPAKLLLPPRSASQHPASIAVNCVCEHRCFTSIFFCASISKMWSWDQAPSQAPCSAWSLLLPLPLLLPPLLVLFFPLPANCWGLRCEDFTITWRNFCRFHITLRGTVISEPTPFPLSLCPAQLDENHAIQCFAIYRKHNLNSKIQIGAPGWLSGLSIQLLASSQKCYLKNVYISHNKITRKYSHNSIN
ncbi:unnamed protein product [Nyctereutes procyonoides]|uniref:(raccoon dog) hypothetical protein n=1 Tax=Nyctereutes procyonoides TaxID=34880 RepID=A0A811Y8C7_NYCPR|nr:unnamed protein product [Nyctereutes procyonoides]